MKCLFPTITKRKCLDPTEESLIADQRYQGDNVPKPQEWMFCPVSPDLFEELKGEWAAQALGFGDTSYADGYLQHAESIITKPKPAMPRGSHYGVYALTDDETNCHGLAHFNRALLPGTQGWTLRVVWTLLAPRYDYEELSDEKTAEIISGILFSSFKLCRDGGLASENLKLHMPSRDDRRLAVLLAKGLENDSQGMQVSVRGNWLHLDNVT